MVTSLARGVTVDIIFSWLVLMLRTGFKILQATVQRDRNSGIPLLLYVLLWMMTSIGLSKMVGYSTPCPFRKNVAKE